MDRMPAADGGTVTPTRAPAAPGKPWTANHGPPTANGRGRPGTSGRMSSREYRAGAADTRPCAQVSGVFAGCAGSGREASHGPSRSAGRSGIRRSCAWTWPRAFTRRLATPRACMSALPNSRRACRRASAPHCAARFTAVDAGAVRQSVASVPAGSVGAVPAVSRRLVRALAAARVAAIVTPTATHRRPHRGDRVGSGARLRVRGVIAAPSGSWLRVFGAKCSVRGVRVGSSSGGGITVSRGPGRTGLRARGMSPDFVSP